MADGDSPGVSDGRARALLVDLARDVGLADEADALAGLARWGARLAIDPEPPPPGQSKFGGLPDLRPGEPWPEADAGRLTAFVGQIATRDLLAIQDGPPRDLHASLLSFFVYIDLVLGEVTGGRVLAIPREQRLEPAPGPGAGAGAPSLRKHSVRGLPELTLPTWAPYERAAMRVAGVCEEKRDAYDRLRAALAVAQVGELPCHRLLGHPSEIVDDVLVEAAMLERFDHALEELSADVLETASESWRVLLRFEDDRELGSGWLRGGSVFFCVPARDLARGSFESVQAVTQGTGRTGAAPEALPSPF